MILKSTPQSQIDIPLNYLKILVICRKNNCWMEKQGLSKFELIYTTFFQGGTKGKMLKNCQLVFQHFFFGAPLGNYEKKMSKWAQILRGFTKSKKKHMLKISAVYLIGNPEIGSPIPMTSNSLAKAITNMFPYSWPE